MHKYEYVYKSPSTRRGVVKKSTKIFQFFISCFFVLCIIFILFVLYKGISENVIGKVIISPVSKGITSSVASIQSMIFPERLEDVVSRVLKGQQGEYAVSIKNLKTNESYEVLQNKVFQSASLYKLWVMAATMQQIEKGEIDPKKVLTKDIAKLNKAFDIGTDSAELTDGVFELEIERAINQMIVVSNNYAGLALMQEVGASRVSSFLRDNGLFFSKVGNPPVTTASDVRLFYEKLYHGVFASKEFTEKMLTMLKNQEINDRIPKYLPDTLDIGHKTGELDSFKHDAGIIFAPHGDYILVVLSNTQDPQVAVENIAQISKAVYAHFEKK